MDNYFWLFIFSLLGLRICCVVMNIYERETQRVAVVGVFSGIAVPTRVSADIRSCHLHDSQLSSASRSSSNVPGTKKVV